MDEYTEQVGGPILSLENYPLYGQEPGKDLVHGTGIRIGLLKMWFPGFKTVPHTAMFPVHNKTSAGITIKYLENFTAIWRSDFTFVELRKKFGLYIYSLLYLWYFNCIVIYKNNRQAQKKN